MKKSIVILLISAACFTNTKAQEFQFNYGPRVGLTVMPVEKNETLGTNFQLGINAGGYFSYNISNRFSIRPELNYSLKKQFSSSADTTDVLSSLGDLVGQGLDGIELPEGINLNAYSNTRSRHALHYIEIPVLATLHLSNVKISAGPFVGMLVGAKTNSETKLDIPLFSIIDLGEQIPFFDFFVNSLFPGYNEPVTSETSGNSAFNKLDAGVITDLTYQLDNNLNFGIRYQQGFIDFRKNYKGDKKLQSSLQILVGYNFGKKKTEGPRVKSYKYEGN
jgi:hypothetical protein